MPSTFFVDFAGAQGSGDGSSAANVSPLISTLSGVVAGDFIKVAKTRDSTSTGQNASWTNQSLTVTLTSALTAAIYSDGLWTTSANITPALDTAAKKEGANSHSMLFGSAFTTGLAAYWATGTLDLSAYQQISFMFKSSSINAANTFRIDLCSDTVGMVPVNSFTINRSTNTNQWTPFTFDNGSALGSSIQSVAIVCLTDPGVPVVNIDNIIACKAPSASDCLTLNTLISDDNAIWWPIKSISGTTVVVDTNVNSLVGAGRGWTGTTGSRTIYVRQPQKLVPTAAATTSIIGCLAVDGTSGSHITVSGGWDPSGSMTTQNGETYLESDGFGNFTITRSWWDWSKISTSRINQVNLDKSGGFTGGSMSYMSFIGFTAVAMINNLDPVLGYSLTDCNFISCASTGKQGAFQAEQMTRVQALSCGGTGINLLNPVLGQQYIGCYLHDITVANNGAIGLSVGVSFRDMRNITSKYNAGVSFNIAAANDSTCIYNLVATGNGSAAIAGVGKLLVYGLTSSGNSNTLGAGTSFLDSVAYGASISDTNVLPTSGQQMWACLRTHRENGDPLQNRTISTLGTIITQTTTKASGAPFAYKFSPTNSLAISSDALSKSMGKFEAKAGKILTVKYQVQRDNASLNGQLRVAGGRYPGVGSAGSDITQALTDAVDSAFHDQSIAVTPTEDCVIEVFADFWGGTTYNGYISGPVIVTST